MFVLAPDYTDYPTPIPRDENHTNASAEMVTDAASFEKL